MSLSNKEKSMLRLKGLKNIQLYNKDWYYDWIHESLHGKLDEITIKLDNPNDQLDEDIFLLLQYFGFVLVFCEKLKDNNLRYEEYEAKLYVFQRGKKLSASM